MSRRIVRSSLIFMFLLAVCCDEVAVGQGTVSLRGLVTDHHGIPLERATVTLGKKMQSATNDKGQFVFRQVNEGNYLLRVSFLGYKLSEQEVRLNADTTVNIRLTPQDAETGIRHEAQEWGADHGLEIDQHGIERIELIKGPASLLYGSNAIGGVITLEQLAVPAEHTSGGSIDLSARSNTSFLRTSAMSFLRKEKWYLKGRVSLLPSQYRPGLPKQPAQGILGTGGTWLYAGSARQSRTGI